MTLDEFVQEIDPEDRTPATEAEVARFEALIGHALPDAYRALLLLTGGGHINGRCRFGNGDGEPNRYYLVMLGLTPEGPLSLEGFHQNPGWYPVPTALLVIGNDSGGNSLAISLRDDRFGEVFLIDHELVSYDKNMQETIEEAEEYGLAMPYAPSFGDLLANSALTPT